MILWAALAIGGELHGVVHTPGGGPVPHTLVLAYDERLAYAYAFSDAEGAWRIDGLGPQRYRVRMIPPDTVNRLERWAGARLDMCEAEVFELVDDADMAEVPLSVSRSI